MSVNIQFADSDIEDDIDGSQCDSDNSDSNSERSSDSGEIEFNSDNSDSQGDSDEDNADDVEDETKDGIDLAEFYDETPKKSAKAIFNRRKRTKPPKVAKAKRLKKKKGCDEIQLPLYILCDVRIKTLSVLSPFTTEKNCRIVEKTIYNVTLDNLKLFLKRKILECDVLSDIFKKEYTCILYSVLYNFSEKINSKEIINILKYGKIGLKSVVFRNEIFVDSQETNNIENPPRVMTGIHTCSVCIKNPLLKSDPDRGKRTDSYQLQTRSCDEAITNFIRCTDCGKKWKF